MLIEKKIKEGDIVALSMISGQEIIAKVKRENEREYILSKPVAISPTGNGVGLMPAMFCADMEGEFHLNKSSVALLSLTVDKNVKDKYIELTSGIKPATSLHGLGNI